MRVIANGAWGFASTESAAYSDWLRCLNAALELARVSAAHASEPVVLAEAPAVVDEVMTECLLDPAEVPLEKKVAAARGYEEASARRAGEFAANLRTGYSDARLQEIVCNTRGACVSSDTVRTMVWHAITTRDGAVRQQAFETRARQCGFELIESTPAEELSVPAAARARALLWAKPAPAGSFPAVFAPSITGLLVHEAVGHHCGGRFGAGRAVHPARDGGERKWPPRASPS